MKNIRIAILGAESTGKTTLCIELKQALISRSVKTTIKPEALREFCKLHNRVPTKEEQLDIMREQATLEKFDEDHDTLGLRTLSLSDCAPITIAIYSDLYFSDKSLYPDAEIYHATYDLSILLAPNIGWQSDGIFRDSPAAQQRFHLLMQTWLKNNRHPWLEIDDIGEQRTATAMSAIIPFLR
jgi:HTH-type transcriptional regulator, transcriptional repressor of NAD biosynthesis genes